MLRGPLYHLFILAVVVATMVPSFLLAHSRVRFRLLLAYIAGCGCGVILLAIEFHFTNGIWWAEFICVLLLPFVGVLAGIVWRRARTGNW